MELGKILNLAGLAFNFIGVLLMYLANPKINYPIGMLPNGDDLLEKSKDRARTKLFGRGLILVLLGIIFQVLSIFTDNLKCN